jgi:hypothetical protein
MNEQSENIKSIVRQEVARLVAARDKDMEERLSKREKREAVLKSWNAAKACAEAASMMMDAQRRFDHGGATHWGDKLRQAVQEYSRADATRAGGLIMEAFR